MSTEIPPGGRSMHTEAVLALPGIRHEVSKRLRRRRVGSTLAVLALIGVAVALPLVLTSGNGNRPNGLGGATPASRPGHRNVPTTTAIRPPAATTTSPPVTTTTSSPVSDQGTSTTTSLAGRVLPPASTASVVSVCDIALDHSNDGGATPLFCADGGVNALAWAYYANLYPQLMGIGANAGEAQVIGTMCSDSDRGGSYPTLELASQLAARYYGWSFASDPAFARWPFYPPNTDECPGAY